MPRYLSATNRMEANEMTGSMARVSHVNLMTDTVIANLSPDALRVILRSMLAADENGQVTQKLQHHVQKYLRHDLQRTSIPALFTVVEKSTSTPPSSSSSSISSSSSSSPPPPSSPSSSPPPIQIPTPELAKSRSRICSLLGSGLAFESMELLAEVVRQSPGFKPDDGTLEGEQLAQALAAVDGDIVQALTAVQKMAIVNNWRKENPLTNQRQVLLVFRSALEYCRRQSDGMGLEFPFERGSMMLESILSRMMPE
ncbi:hypothetical protein ACJ72_06268 [Emergomyces africanus]|uniref:Uncharacterized protein n=1 Tax=Emergomyces africanus TaxID=1955775 RepID=A0A1B7NRK3_9EURO|nr:hypothetical protein ACJ72_06268 [Emergomyces africanus]